MVTDMGIWVGMQRFQFWFFHFWLQGCNTLGQFTSRSNFLDPVDHWDSQDDRGLRWRQPTQKVGRYTPAGQYQVAFLIQGVSGQSHNSHARRPEPYQAGRGDVLVPQRSSILQLLSYISTSWGTDSKVPVRGIQRHCLQGSPKYGVLFKYL